MFKENLILTIPYYVNIASSLVVNKKYARRCIQLQFLDSNSFNVSFKVPIVLIRFYVNFKHRSRSITTECVYAKNNLKNITFK